MQTIRGMHDLFGDTLKKIELIEAVAKQVAQKYNFQEMRTPIMEYASVFEKNVGESTDIVSKEMYAFETRSNEKVVLRPEGTAPVVRALISNKLTHSLPLRFFYIGEMFRYERPQRGRQRQFNSIGFEYLGTNSYTTDVEMINLSVDVLKALGITDYELLINSLGSSDSLIAYKAALLDYLNKYATSLSEDSKVRLQKNPLRILDSKDAADKEIVATAPKITDFLNANDKNNYDKIKNTLTKLNIDFTEDSKLVRGLDYYNDTVFEIVRKIEDTKLTLIGGGRYDALIKQMGGPDVGAFGFGGGIERLALCIDAPKASAKSIAIITLDSEFNEYALALADTIRQEYNFGASFILGKDVTNKLKKTSTDEYFLAIIIGEDEIKNKIYSVKDLLQFSQEKVPESKLAEFLKQKYSMYEIK